MMITPLGTGGGCHVSVMVVKVLFKAWSPVTGSSAGEEEDGKDGGARREKDIINHNYTQRNQLFT